MRDRVPWFFPCYFCLSRCNDFTSTSERTSLLSILIRSRPRAKRLKGVDIEPEPTRNVIIVQSILFILRSTMEVADFPSLSLILGTGMLQTSAGTRRRVVSYKNWLINHYESMQILLRSQNGELIEHTHKPNVRIDCHIDKEELAEASSTHRLRRQMMD